MKQHKSGDGWGRADYEIPDLAVAGCSYCGEWSDSPATEEEVRRELELVRAMLEAQGVNVAKQYQRTESGNMFTSKIWLCVAEAGAVEEAERLVAEWLDDHNGDTKLVHDAVC